jgi:hypothetical protein
MMRPNTREGIYLTHQSAVVFKFFGSKDTIVSVKFVDFDTFLFSKRFKVTFALDGFSRIIRVLTKIEQLSTSMVNKKSATRIPDTFTSKSVGKATHFGGKVMINQHAMTRNKMQPLQDVIFGGFNG